MKSPSPASSAPANELAQGVELPLPESESTLPGQFHQDVSRRVIAATVAFFGAWLVVNRGIFFEAVQDSGDTATILLQVYNAKRFHELLGNYSRWQFHHPGPAFMYLLALGDAVFRDLLHIVPSPWNSAALTLLVLYTACLFATIFLFQRQSRSPWFLPGAVLATVWFLYVVDRTTPGSASGGVWMPYIIMPVFLLFVAACASLAAGNGRHLPLGVFCGGLLIHGHVAQLLFVGVLLSVAFLFWLVPNVRRAGLRPTIKLYRAPLFLSLGIVLLFLLPVLLEATLHHPSNIHNLNAYLREHRGPQNTWLICVKYVCSFVAFIPDPEVVLLNPVAHLIQRAVARPYVVAYWGMFVVLLALALGIRITKRAKLSPFLSYVTFELALVAVLVTYWARKIAGGLFAFNSYFFFATFLLASFVLIAYLCDAWTPAAGKRWSLALACVLPFLMLASPPDFQALQGRDDQTRDAQIRAIVAGIPHDRKRVFLTWSEPQYWPLATGIASRLQNAGRTYCVTEDWSFMFAQSADCRDAAGAEEVGIFGQPYRCTAPCQTIYQNAEIVVTLSPFFKHSLPFALESDSPDALPEGFNGAEGLHGREWTRRHSALIFLLNDSWNPTPVVRIALKGVVRPGDPVVLALNGHPVGTISQGGLVSVEFQVPASYFRAGASNELSFQVDNAGPAGGDRRTLGFQLWAIQFLPE